MNFHAHVYFDQDTRSKAESLQSILSTIPNITVGKLRDEPIGPHPKSMFAVTFTSAELVDVLNVLMFVRKGLDVLVHPRSGNDLADHTTNCFWLGNKLELDLSKL